MLIWYLARGAGIAAYATLSLATALGVWTARRGSTDRRAVERRVIVQYLHRSASLTGLALLVLHVITILADPYAKVGITGTLVPFAASYRPVAVTLGVLAVYLLALAAVTGLLRARFARSPRAWRKLHLAGYLAWAMSAGHFALAGTDTGQPWARDVLVAGVAAVALGALARFTGHRPQPPAEIPARTGVAAR